MFVKIDLRRLVGIVLIAAMSVTLSLFSLSGRAQEDLSVGHQVSPEFEAEYREALDRFNRSDIAGALEILNRMAVSDPKMLPPRLIMAQWFTKLKNPSAVRLSLEKAVEETPDDPEAYILLAENSLRRGEWAAADLLLGQAGMLLDENPGLIHPGRRQSLTISLLRNEVVLYQARENWPAMQQALSQLWKQGERTSDTCKLIGVSYFHLGEPGKAKQWFTQAHKISSATELSADAMMARLYLAVGDRQHAQEALDAALEADPDSQVVLNLTLVMALGSGDRNRVKELVDRVLTADAHDPATLKTCGIAALYLEDYPRAEAIFEEGLRMHPGNPEIENGLALALCEQNNPEKIRKAVQHATANLQKQNHNREYLATLGWALYKAGDQEKALSYLQLSAADGRINSQTAYYLAQVLAAKGETEHAKKLLSASLAGTAPFTKRMAAEELRRKLK
ncbi:MAG: tetratricopeptide repeat protein [Thermoguttaceae bacterium]|jgi:tetratricopeptide (TPR) repeat protein